MLAPPYLLFAGKVATATLAGAAALAVSLIAVFYAVALCGSSLRGTAISVVFGLVALAMLVALGYAFRKLSWPLRAVVGGGVARWQLPAPAASGMRGGSANHHGLPMTYNPVLLPVRHRVKSPNHAHVRGPYVD
jgi:hypothetical protein